MSKSCPYCGGETAVYYSFDIVMMSDAVYFRTQCCDCKKIIDESSIDRYPYRDIKELERALYGGDHEHKN